MTNANKSQKKMAHDAKNPAEIPGKNPKGIPQQSPGLRGTSYPGIIYPIDDNPERVAAHGSGSATRPQPR